MSLRNLEIDEIFDERQTSALPHNRVGNDINQEILSRMTALFALEKPINPDAIMFMG